MDYPTFLPGWETVKQIGKGGFSLVFKIKQTDKFLGDVYSALKVIEVPKENDEYQKLELEGYDAASIKTIFKEQVNKIVAESEIMFKFRGAPNIVNFESHNVIETEKGFIVLIKMELLEPLLEYNKRHHLNEGEIVHLGMSICDALKLCSKERIVHRDIKPENIFVDKFENFKLGDFGIARVMEHTMRATQIGTRSFIAPEVVLGNPYNHRADIYSLGLTLYWFLNELRLPFLPLPPAVPTPSDNMNAYFRRIKGEKLPPPVNGCDQLKKVILKACEANPDDRYSSADEFYNDLDDVRSALRRGKATYTGNLESDVTSQKDEKVIIPNDEPTEKAPDTIDFNYDPYKVADDFAWNISDGTLTISGHGKMPDFSAGNKAPWDSDKFIIKSVVISNGISSIENSAFEKCEELTSVTIPNSVMVIGDNAFSNCTNLSLITIPNSVTTIGMGAFSDCKNLTSINIPNSVTKIGTYPFYKCTSLSKIDVGASNPEYISFNGALFNKDKTELIVFPACEAQKSFNVPSSVININSGAFNYCVNLTSITIPESVSTIGNGAFFMCDSLKTVTISSSVTTIGALAFSGCKSLYEIKYAGTKAKWDTISKGDSWNKSTGNYTVQYVQSKSDSPQITKDGKNEPKYDPNKVAPNFTWNISNGILTISGNGKMPDYSSSSKAPWDLKFHSVTSIVISDGITSIGKNAFEWCANLKSVTIPYSVTTIGNEAFYKCESLSEIRYKGTKTQWKSISKGYGWKNGTAAFSVKCSDSTISKLFA